MSAAYAHAIVIARHAVPKQSRSWSMLPWIASSPRSSQ
jgi:hypothetical protein